MIRSSGSAAEIYAVQRRTYVASLRISSERTGISARGKTRATRTRRTRRTKVVDEEDSVKDSTFKTRRRRRRRFWWTRKKTMTMMMMMTIE